MFSITVKTRQKEELVDISAEVRRLLTDHGMGKELCLLYVPHTTAALTINENADPDVKRDIIHGLNLIVPDQADYRHIEGNSAAHIKSSLLGASETIFIDQGKLVLGTWQGIYLAEFDGPRSRSVLVKFV